MAKTTDIKISVDELVDLDTDGTLAANSDGKIPSQKAVKTYVDANAGTSNLIVDDLSASCDGSNTGFTLSQTRKAMLGVVWNTAFHVTDFSVSGTLLTTHFLDGAGNPIAPLGGDKLYALYFA